MGPRVLQDSASAVIAMRLTADMQWSSTLPFPLACFGCPPDAIRSYAPGFIFTTSLPPAVAAGAAASVAHLKSDKDLRAQHQTQSKILKYRLKGIGLPIIDHGSHIVPVIVGNPVHTQKLSDMLLQDFGIYVQPINFPTVPRGTERLRFTPSPVHGPAEIDALVRAMDTLWAHCALNRAENSA